MFDIQRVTIWVVEELDVRPGLPGYIIRGHFTSEDRVELFVLRWVIESHARGAKFLYREPYWYVSGGMYFSDDYNTILHIRKLTDEEIGASIAYWTSDVFDAQYIGTFGWVSDAISRFIDLFSEGELAWLTQKYPG